MELTYDTFALVFEQCSTQSLIRCAGVCKLFRSMVSAELRRRYFTVLRWFFGTRKYDAHELLQSHRAIISGSTALAFLAWTDTWTPSDMDIYVPNSSYGQFVYDLEHRQLGWFEANLGSGNHSDYHGILTVRRYITPTGERLDVIQSSTANAAQPLLHFWTSAVVNILSPFGAVCAFPKTTLDHKALVSGISRSQKLVAARIKYEARGFQFAEVGTWRAAADSEGVLTLSNEPILVVDFLSVWSANSTRLPITRAGSRWVLVPDHTDLISGKKFFVT
ncbi:hypothetical protein GSI_13690 [Ganoderma sinense ZZ0214-1]|uniref:F-box domain-containing protein n=1 Tax=Ganoderma sinense ZZ0214-1 TaxID=1077348 RepID=A0A2G8RR05_9APHY|nr:hypothetical protein GSI_13690 [Ganoderma sinense ZZ0214-1]